MLWNPGQLPPEWTVERLTETHSSRPYNPDVANAFFRAGMIEAWGRGIERIMEACRAAGVPVLIERQLILGEPTFTASIALDAGTHTIAFSQQAA